MDSELTPSASSVSSSASCQRWKSVRRCSVKPLEERRRFPIPHRKADRDWRVRCQHVGDYTVIAGVPTPEPSSPLFVTAGLIVLWLKDRAAVQVDVLTNHTGVGAELPLPITVTQNCDESIGRRLIVCFGDRPPERSANAEERETVAAGEHTFSELRFPRSRYAYPRVSGGAQTRKRFAAAESCALPVIEHQRSLIAHMPRDEHKFLGR